MSAAALNEALELIQKNNLGSLDRALSLLQSTVYSFSMRVCGHAEDAEDTAQEVLIKSLPYPGSRVRRRWLCGGTRLPELAQLTFTQQSDPETALLRQESQQRLREALTKVPALYRIVLVLHDMEGLSKNEVAQVTGVREGTVRVRLHRGRLMLRRELERLASARPKAVHTIIPAADKGAKPRSASCRKMFADLSDYVDGLVSDARRREMEKHIDDCQPCVVFLRSLRSAVAQCRNYQPVCDTARARQLRKELMEKYQVAVAALPQ